jgi:hypothetical protein
MDRYEMFDHMVDALCVGCPPEERNEFKDCVVPATFLPYAKNWVEDIEYMDANELDGTNWTEAVPAELGENGQLWVLKEDRLFVFGICGGGPSTLNCYWIFRKVA